MIEYYQNLGMPGDENKEHKNRKNSRYWNEGKWNHYIAPLLPKDCKDMTFVDIGCNAGLFLKLAKDMGFRDVIGVDKSRKACLRAIKYRDYLGYDYKILHRTVGVNFSFEEIPVADVVLLANVHYYFQLNDWLKFLDQLYNRTHYCLIISRPLNTKHHWVPKTLIPDIKYYFRDWEKIGAIYQARHGWRERNDPSPRELWSFMFKSRLRRVKLDDLLPGAPARLIKIPTAKLYKAINKNPTLDLRKTSYYKAWHKREKDRWPEERIYNFVKQKADLWFDIKENGIKDPILVLLDNKIVDGGHRVAIARELGYKSILVRTI